MHGKILLPRNGKVSVNCFCAIVSKYCRMLSGRAVLLQLFWTSVSCVLADDESSTQGKSENILESLERSMHPELMKVQCLPFSFSTATSLHYPCTMSVLCISSCITKATWKIIILFWLNSVPIMSVCGQALISMPFFVLVWKRNRSAKQTEQEWWKTKHLFFRSRSPGKHSHICQCEVLFTVSCLPCPLAWPQKQEQHVFQWRTEVQPIFLHNEMSVLKYPTQNPHAALLEFVWCTLMLLEFKPDFLWGSEKFSCLQEEAVEEVLHGYLQGCMGSAHLEQGAVVAKAMAGVYRRSLSLQGVIKCR